MKKEWRRLGILLVFLPAAAGAVWRQQARANGGEEETSEAWPELVKSMDKMHMAVAAEKSSGESDVDFVNVMLPHHQAAIDMAKTELLYGKDQQMRRLAQEIITDQESEIELMNLWQKRRDTRSNIQK